MRTKMWLTAMAALTIAGCSQNEVMETKKAENGAIGFSVYSGVHTRAAVTDYDAIKNGSGFGVMAIKGSEKYMKTTHVTHDGENPGGWTYAPPVYWPDDGSTALSFYAYAPYNGEGISRGDADADFETPTAPSVTLTLGTPKKMVDMVAAKAENQTNGSQVSLAFKHVLSRLALQARTKSDYASTTVKITGLKILGSSTNTYSLFYNKAKYDIKSDTWTLEDKQESDWTIIETDDENTYPAVTVTGTTPVSILNDEYLFLIPVGAGEATKAIQMEMTYKVTSNGIPTETTKTFSFTSGSEKFLQKGKAYLINFTITLNEITFTVEQDMDWDGETTVEPTTPTT